MIASTAAALAFATLLSEALTTVTAGLLVAEGTLDPFAAIGACVFGIYVGDLALWAVGRVVGVRVLRWRGVREIVTPAHEVTFARWFTQNAASIVLGSRFLPGSRLPLYLSAGAFGVSAAIFARWSLVAVLLWTPPVVLLSAAAGRGPVETIAAFTGSVWSAYVIVAISVLAAARLLRRLWTSRARYRLIAAVSRIWRWEFWPMWLFYAPVAAWTLLLAVRYRGFRTITAANPGMPDGGVVGESKHGILSRLPQEWVVPGIAVSPGEIETRMWSFLQQTTRQGWRLPLVFKPDVGQRGTGVKLVTTVAAAREYLEREHGSVLVQPYHAGPFEAGVFYYRRPHSSHGRILSITDKQFPVLTGDGHSTVEDLIWADARLRMQARTFLRRHAAIRDRVLPAGERLSLTLAGNHAQGTLFRDGRHLLTRALEERIDAIARTYDGFFIGRFDVRYTDVERFKAGEDLAIVELNGATAESTNIYDPRGSLVAAYRQLFRQWQLVFAIGAANRSAGIPASSSRRLAALLLAHLTTTPAFSTSD